MPITVSVPKDTKYKIKALYTFIGLTFYEEDKQ